MRRPPSLGGRTLCFGAAKPRDSSWLDSPSHGLAELTRNAVDVLPEGELERKLALGRPLRVKLGIDVTAPDVHARPRRPARSACAPSSDEGHTGVLIVGDYTTRIGDPSGRSAERPVLPDEEHRRERASATSSRPRRSSTRDRTEVRFNGEWLGKLDFAELVRADADDHGRPPARARRLRQALRGPARRSRSRSSSTR